MKPKNRYHGNRRTNYRGQSGSQRDKDYNKPDFTSNPAPKSTADNAETGKKLSLDAIDETLSALELLADKDFMETGRDLAVLFRAMCTAAAKLPTMELTTELMSVHNDKDGLTVYFDRAAVDGKGHEEGKGYEDDEDDHDFDDVDFDDLNLDFDEEEGMLYDGD